MIYINKQGQRVETYNDAETAIKFFRQGGGFQHGMKHDVFHAEFALAPLPVFRAGTVTADWFDNGVKFPCYSNGNLWNGWGVPFFTRLTIDLMSATSSYDNVTWVDGKLMIAEDDEIHEISPTQLLGVDEPVYGLGAESWCWDQVEFVDQATIPQMSEVIST